jgi:hypothetical protein
VTPVPAILLGCPVVLRRGGALIPVHETGQRAKGNNNPCDSGTAWLGVASERSNFVCHLGPRRGLRWMYAEPAPPKIRELHAPL